MIERHSKVFVPVSVDLRLPKKAGTYAVVRIYSDDIEIAEFDGSVFTNYHGYKVTHWLEEKENVYVLTEQELNDAMVNFAQLIIAQYNTGNTNISQTPLMNETCELYIQSKTNPQTKNK